MERIKRLPVPILPTFVGVATLGNVYNGFNHPFIRHLSMYLAGFVLLLYIIKIIKYPSVIKDEYGVVIPASLYAGFTMITMILGSYIFEYNPQIGKVIWFAGLIIHAIHILVFTYKNVIKKRSIDTFVPTWFVTYNGIMVSCVVGGAMNESQILTYVTYYGIGIYLLLIGLLIYRLIKFEIKKPMLQTTAVVLAPCSLCVVSYLNVINTPNHMVVYFLYACVLASLTFVIVMLPKYFSHDFHPGFAALTFPMAIGVVASTKMTSFLTNIGNTQLAGYTSALSSLQLYLTTMIIGYVVLQFVIMAFRLKTK